MSYEIIYAREFVKTSDGRIIPLVLSGSNNCRELTFRGYERRERVWHAIFSSGDENPAMTPEKLMTKINEYIPSGYNQHFVRNGKWVDDAGFIKFFENGIKKAKTLEELNSELLYEQRLEGIVLNREETANNQLLYSATIKNSAELDEFLNKVDEFISNKLSLSIIMRFQRNDVLRRRKKQKENLKEFYVVTTDFGYVSKLTRLTLYSTHSAEHAKKFTSEKAAMKWIKDRNLEIRFSKQTFGVKYIA